MLDIGYKLSSEEFGPRDLVDFAVRAEKAGFGFGLISDHFHPWCDAQGQSPFVWTVLGAIAQATTRLQLGTAVTCPTMRVHPAIVAQAAATTAALMPGRFFLGLGTGENLNEHVIGEGWPAPGDRLEMLTEAIEVIRLLWSGENENHRGTFFSVEDARLYTLPATPPPIMIAASNPKAAELAAEAGDAIINTAVMPELLERFDAAGGKDKPRYVEMTVCWAADETQARKTAREVWSLAALGDPLFTELRIPSHFEAAFEPITEDMVAEKVVCGPDAAKHVAAIEKAGKAGYTHVCVHQVGPDQKGFFEFYEREVLPAVGRERRTRKAG
ncbi:MAG TPA: TIGR03557 family F420-dependent LLM class oxidoreductase [Candidatus Binatia bacterium]|nr:TIGR03557 family F420-dependent LLM class oxidoreductase [Candidatus Binatia bacterium]